MPELDVETLDELLRQLPDPEKDREGQIEVLQICFDQVFGGRLGHIAAASGLAPDGLRQTGLQQADAILVDATALWEALRFARFDQRQRELNRREGEASLPYVRRVVDLFLRTPVLLLRLVAGVAGIVGLSFGMFYVIPIGGDTVRTVASVLVGLGGLSALAQTLVQDRTATGAAVAAERVEALASAYATQLREGVAGWVREQINEAQQAAYDTNLQFGDRGGLAEVDDPKHEIPTDAKERLLSLVEDEAMPGGAIGLAGPRGAGKSTLMRAVCVDLDQREDVLGTMVDAPVDYDPRDFVLHLFAKVCAEVVGTRRVAELRRRDRPEMGVGVQLEGFPPLPVIAGASLMLVGCALFFQWLPGGGVLQGAAPFFGFLAFVLIGFGFVLHSVLHEAPRRRQRRLTRELLESGTKDGQTAMALLQQIWFQRTFSSGWSGSFQSSVGLESVVSSGVELAERQMSFPEIVDSFRQFLEQISQTRQVRIGIDELDKMEDETARKFLNEIKVVFRVPGCFFMISISEDAMSYFERRGLPIRDVFDSSFDDVIWVPYLPFDGSRSLLARRIVGLPQPFVCLVHCLSGGLPRDLIRAARNLVGMPRGTTIGRAATKMSQVALGSKLNGARVAARRFRSEGAVRVLTEWLDHLRDAQVSAAALREACGEVQSKFLAPLVASSGADSAVEERAEVKALGLQLAASAYFSVTLREFFARFDSEEFINFALRKESGESRVDWLAGIPQKLSEDLGSGWEDLSMLRYDCEMEVVSFPLHGGIESGAPDIASRLGPEDFDGTDKGSGDKVVAQRR